MSTTPTVEPLDERIDHVRGPAGAPLILEYGDYECPYSRQAFRAIERVEHEQTQRAGALIEVVRRVNDRVDPAVMRDAVEDVHQQVHRQQQHGGTLAPAFLQECFAFQVRRHAQHRDHVNGVSPTIRLSFSNHRHH